MIPGKAQNDTVEPVVGNDEVCSPRNDYMGNLLPANNMEQLAECTGIRRLAESGRTPADPESSMDGEGFFETNNNIRNRPYALQNAEGNGHLSSAYRTRRPSPGGGNRARSVRYF